MVKTHLRKIKIHKMWSIRGNTIQYAIFSTLKKWEFSLFEQILLISTNPLIFFARP